MLKRKNLQLGFTLIEILVASFIFASILAVVYGLLNDALISKKELELTLTINEQVKNANEILQSVMREASGDFFMDGEFKAGDPNNIQETAHLFFVSEFYAKPDLMVVPADYKTAINGRHLYVKVSQENEKKIYIFSLDRDNLTRKNYLYLESWEKDAGWKIVQNKTPLLEYDSNLLARFSVAQDKNQEGFSTPKSYYVPGSGQLVPMDLSVNLTVTAIKNWRNKNYARNLNQVYVPLITSNPYL